MILVGVDGGATSTVTVAIDDDFKVLGTGVAGGINPNVEGGEKVHRNLELSIEEAFSEIGEEQVDIGCFGMGGGFKAVINLRRTKGNMFKDYLLKGDAELVYYASTFGNPGVGIVAGTGSSAYGVNRFGDITRTGGWGWLLGDEGSAFSIARKALNKATRGFDGREKATIVNLAKDFFDVTSFREILDIVYQIPVKIYDIAGFAPIISKAAESGNELAREIITEAGEELALLAEVTVDRGNIDKPIIGEAGGVWNSKLIWDIFSRKVKRKIPQVTLKDPIKHPVLGALIIGLNTKNIDYSMEDLKGLTEEIERKLKEKSRIYNRNIMG